MKLSTSIALIAAIGLVLATQIPLLLPPIDKELQSQQNHIVAPNVFNEYDLSPLSSTDQLNLQNEWVRLENHLGTFQMLSQFNQFRKIFNKPKTNLTYSITTDQSTPESIGFDSVKQISGYFHIKETHKKFFYWFFESRNDPANDPLILWLNGGPGCSSTMGLALELGPSIINASIQLDFNPYSWNSNASLLFLDQPIQVGFSDGDDDEIPFSTEQAAIDFGKFVELFRNQYPEYAKLDFHIAGESYAGHYIPSFASTIVNNGVPLKSIMIGNGITDYVVQLGEKANIGCGKGGLGKLYKDNECSTFDQRYKRFLPFGELCYKFPNPITCYISLLASPTTPDKGDLNPYDARLKCNNDAPWCYPEFTYIDQYFNTPKVQHALLGSNALQKNYTVCNKRIEQKFFYDLALPYQQYVAQLLNDGVAVLIYAGDKDLTCDWLGNLAWCNKLDYSDQKHFNSSVFRPWTISDDEKVVHTGEVKNYKQFTYLRFFNAGHMVPMDQPQNSLNMVNSWIQGNYALL